jgi:hypothetical protein
MYRDLQEKDDTSPTMTPSSSTDTAAATSYQLWEIIYTTIVLVLMTVALVSDRVGADHVMMIALTLFMAAGIITVAEGTAGFANEGLLTVMALFVVADGISKTGALDWYMAKLLGRPKSATGAQLRLMAPIALVSAFLNNTPVVAVMIPIVQRWAKNVNISPQQLLIPLSFASILGGTCTLIGTSTNLVVAGLLQETHPEVVIGLFDLTIYGVPVALAGIMYVLLASPWLLPGGSRRRHNTHGQSSGTPLEMASNEDILFGAKLMPWSPAAGRSVKRSGLRDTGGLYLVSVHRAATGNVHRAVGQDFVLNVGDVLYFTGLVEGFGEFCEEHGMEVLTNDNVDTLPQQENEPRQRLDEPHSTKEEEEKESEPPVYTQGLPVSPLRTVLEGEEASANGDGVPMLEVGLTKESLLQADEAERSRSITRMIGKDT